MPKRNPVVPVYFHSLEIENVRCFGERQSLSLTEGDRPARWTLILGDNGVGKTTLLQCLTGMLPTPDPRPNRGQNKRSSLKDDYVGFALQNEENATFDSLIRAGTRGRAALLMKVSVRQRLIPLTKGRKPATRSNKIVSVGIELHTDSKGRLEDFSTGRRQTIRKAFGGMFPDPLVVTYGANRQLGERNLTNDDLGDAHTFARLRTVTELYDAEQILADLDYASQKDRDSKKHLGRFKAALAHVLPRQDYTAESFKIYPPDLLRRDKRSGVYLKTPFGLVRLAALSLGYQTMLAWTTDLAWRLLQRYPRSANPLAEPAVVLIDEIDLHLHPLWQLTVIDSLSEIFPGTQFVATAHSPLMVQVAQRAHIVLLRRRNNAVEIVDDPESVRGWRLDQIYMSQLFEVPSARDSDAEQLFAEQDELLDKPSLTGADKERLNKLRARISKLPTASEPRDRRAMEIIRKAAALLTKHKVVEP